MLQRIQTIYLIIIIACLFVASFASTGIYTFQEDKVEMSAIVSAQGVNFELIVDGEVKDLSKEIEELEADLRESGVIENNKIITPGTLKKIKNGIQLPLYIPFLMLICLNIGIIFSYKKLKRQLSLARLNTFLCILLAAGTIIVFSLGKAIGGQLFEMEKFASELTITTGMGAGFFAAVATLPFALLAQISIKRDLKLIQSIDRIR